MASSVEDRIVRMEFDNAAFERKIKQTITSLAGLDKALKMEGAKKGLADVSTAANRFSLAPMQSAVQGVSNSFLALSTIAVTALATITHSAITAGAQMAKSLTIEPILEGFREFETNVGSIQTILANTRADNTGLDDVNQALDTLNEYSDRTIYNFGQMARNIGTFTAAGVDLQTSVDSIKGISNLAAISGSSAEQAATAMYQLSQAVSTGTLRLMDWNSVVNAGMGGEVFQRALFETGVAMGTITDAPVGTTFEEWTAAGNSFRDSLQSGWLTSEVLTTTLRGFTGEMTEAQLLAIGYTKEQAAAILELGRTGIEAATKIRTLSQLMTTIRETIGSGWSQTFRTVIGDFEESTELFTSINDAISGFVKKQADSRNELLQTWKDLDGRDILIESLSSAFKSLGAVLKPIRDAFQDVFPPLTAGRLISITRSFSRFVETLKPSEQTIQNVGRIFKGLFSILDVGWEIIKAGVGFFKDLIVSITGIGSGGILEFTADIADFFTRLRDGLGGGEKIHEFFDNLTESLQKPIQFIKDLRDSFFGLFDGFDDAKAEVAERTVTRFGVRFEQLGSLAERAGSLWEPFQSALERIGEILGNIGSAIGDWFSELGQKLADAIDTAEFDAILDALNVSLLGGIALILGKFLKSGINFDVGDGLFGNISGAFEQLTGTLETMQTAVRAEALLKIAAAVGILTASVVALSLIDSVALTRALTALAVGFGQLVASFALINALSANLSGAAGFSIIAAGMILLSTAILILTGAVAILAQLSWEELMRGLTGVGLLLAGITAAAIVLSANTGSLISAAVGLSAMAIALSLLIVPVIALAQLSWADLLRGLAGLGILLGGLVVGAIILSAFSGSLLAASVGLTAMSVALALLVGPVIALSSLDWGELAKGLVGVGILLAALVAGGIILANAGPGLILASVGLIAMATALGIVVGAVAILGQLGLDSLIKGLAGVTVALIVMAVAANAMTGALAGAAAILIVAASLGIMSKVLIELGKVPFGNILKALGALALALILFGAAAALLTPIIPALLGLGVALFFVGGAFALFGVGALAIAKAFEILARVGGKAASALTQAFFALGNALPAILVGLAQGIVDFIMVFVDAAPVIAEALGVLLEHIIQTLVDILPMVGELVNGLVDLMVDNIHENSPKLIQAGLELLLNLLNGINENIGDITDVVSDIITNFLNALADNVDQMADAGVALLVAFLSEIGESYVEVYTAVAKLIGNFLLALVSFGTQIATAGAQALVKFLAGITNNLIFVVVAVSTMIQKFIDAVGDEATNIADAGTDALVDFLEGMTDNTRKITETVTTLVTTFIRGISNSASRITASGANAIIRFITGLGQHAGRIVTSGVNTVIKFIQGVGSQAIRLANAAAQVLIDFLNALARVIRQRSPELRAAGVNIATAIIDGITGGLASKAGDVVSGFTDMVKGGVDAVKNALGISSPSKVFATIGEQTMEGFAKGLSNIRPVEQNATSMADAAVASVKDVLDKVVFDMSNMEEFSPTLTPVLDLTQVRNEADRIRGLMPDIGDLSPTASFNRAQQIARSPNPVQQRAEPTDGQGRGDVIFEQTINSPTQLSTKDIYKQTRNQIRIAKEELNVP